MGVLCSQSSLGIPVAKYTSAGDDLPGDFAAPIHIFVIGKSITQFNTCSRPTSGIRLQPKQCARLFPRRRVQDSAATRQPGRELPRKPIPDP